MPYNYVLTFNHLAICKQVGITAESIDKMEYLKPEE
jgi:hypothetical protein